MANLNDLPNIPISQMSRNDLLVHILKIRNARRVPVKATKEPKAKPARPKVERSAKDFLSMLSPEQAEKLLAQLESIPPEEEPEATEENE